MNSGELEEIFVWESLQVDNGILGLDCDAI
jgi:hypothetical protein